MTPTKIFYFDIYLGHAKQSPTAFLRIPLKMAALDWKDALQRAVALGFEEGDIMRMEKYVIGRQNGQTVVQYRWEDTKDMDAYLLGTHYANMARKPKPPTELKSRRYREGAVDRMPD